MSSQTMPNGWTQAKISDIAIRCMQRKPIAGERFTYVDIGSIDRRQKRILDPQVIDGEAAPSRARKVIENGDVLVSLTRPNLNAVALVSKEYHNQIASTGFEVIKPLLVDSRYIFALVRSKEFVDQISGVVQGALYPAAKSSDVQNFKFQLPPLAEQKAIANKLDTLLAQVENTKARLERIPQILKRFRQSVLAAAVSGRLTEEWRLRNILESVRNSVDQINKQKSGKLKVRFQKGWDEKLRLFALPETWDWIPNHKLAEDAANAICAGPFGTIFKAKDFRNSGVPIIFLRHVKDEGFNQRNPRFMDERIWKDYHQDYSVHGGELLVTKLGDPPGESCIYPHEIGTAMVTPDVLKMNVDERLADCRYLMHFFNSPTAKQMVGDLAFGATRLRIDISMFKLIPVPLPPRVEQTEIVHQVEKLFTYADTIEQQVNNALTRVNNLTQSILAKAFRGELTEQWRKDNPDLISGENSAEALLARIKAERAAAKPARSTGKRKVKA